METRKLYYEDCHLKSFAAQVAACNATDKGYAVTLDATAFYPEGGGQACDTGTLGAAQVLSVREKDGAIIHLCDRALTPGESVEGHIDWQRRFDLMQQHTGEHIVSGIIHQLYGYHNVGFHMGAELVTVDFDGFLDAQALEEVERRANAALWQNLSVKCWYPTVQELPGVAYRSKRELPWPVRIVQIPGYDSCACCGVHVAATGEVGLIKLFSAVKFHQGVRIEMACGARALAYLSRVFEQNRQVSQAFSAKPLETAAAAWKMNEALAAEKYRTAGLQRQLFERIAEDYREKGNVLYFAQGLSLAALRELAEKIAMACGGVAAVFCENSAGFDVCLACHGGDVKELGAAMAKALDGRGGGKPGFFQGSVKATREQIKAFFWRDNQLFL